jgi:mRNA interferase MazF
VNFGEPQGAKPAGLRPVLVIQADTFNRSKLATTIVAVITSNTKIAGLPGNVFLPQGTCGLPKDSAVNVTAISTVDKTELGKSAGQLPLHLWQEVSRGLQLIFYTPFSAVSR